MWSIRQEVARRGLAACTDQERGWVPPRRGESWLGLMWEVALLHSSAAKFSRDSTNENITLTEDGTRGATNYRYQTAVSKTVIHAGRHYAEYTVHSLQDSILSRDMMLGVMRPGPRPPPA
jgi:hypothetical protein